jgi:thymidylate kinase
MTQQHLASGKARREPSRAERPDSENAESWSPSGPRDLTGLVTAVFQAWRRAGIEFLVLRNYEKLPEETGNDIDVLVRPGQLARAEEVLVSTAGGTGYVLHNRAEFSPVSLFFHHPASQLQIQFDLFHCLNWRGFPLLSARTVLARRIERGLFAVPHPTHEAVLNLITRQIYHGQVREKYKPGILAGLKQDPAGAQSTLAEMFSQVIALTLTRAILAERWAEVELQTRAMRRQLAWRRLTRQPLATLGAMLRDLRRFAGRLRNPPGMTLVLLGADGCGKSSVATGLIESLRHTFNPGKGLHGHWKPMVLPLRRRAERKPTTDPHAQPPRGRMASLLVLVCHWLEYLVGACVRFLPVLFRNGLVLMDRYHYDFAVDPRRYRLQVSAGAVRALFRLLPAPDLVIVLDAPTEVLRARKQEVPEAETRRQQEAFRTLAASLPCAKIVDCAQPLDAVIRDATGQVLNCLAARQARRLKR